MEEILTWLLHLGPNQESLLYLTFSINDLKNFISIFLNIPLDLNSLSPQIPIFCALNVSKESICRGSFLDELILRLFLKVSETRGAGEL